MSCGRINNDATAGASERPMGILRDPVSSAELPLNMSLTQAWALRFSQVAHSSPLSTQETADTGDPRPRPAHEIRTMHRTSCIASRSMIDREKLIAILESALQIVGDESLDDSFSNVGSEEDASNERGVWSLVRMSTFVPSQSLSSLRSYDISFRQIEESNCCISVCNSAFIFNNTTLRFTFLGLSRPARTLMKTMKSDHT